MRNLWGHCTSRVLCTSSVLGGPVGRVGLIPWVFMASLRSRDAVSPGMHPDEADNHLFELALAATAVFIVTNNVPEVTRGELSFPRLQILTPI